MNKTSELLKPGFMALQCCMLSSARWFSFGWLEDAFCEDLIVVNVACKLGKQGEWTNWDDGFGCRVLDVIRNGQIYLTIWLILNVKMAFTENTNYGK